MLLCRRCGIKTFASVQDAKKQVVVRNNYASRVINLRLGALCVPCAVETGVARTYLAEHAKSIAVERSGDNRFLTVEIEWTLHMPEDFLCILAYVFPSARQIQVTDYHTYTFQVLPEEVEFDSVFV
ncbi:MAG: hypothetical protein D6706_21205 [Chloroflexi bacterium]|nr:MAG: hypothetical protein D6706_21205 [Chloroflexota bacterium]